MEIIFVADGNERSYSGYQPDLQITIRFKKSGEKQEIPDVVAERLIKTFPRMFGKDYAAVKKARGLKEEIVLKEEVEVIIPAKDSIHPFVKATQKIEKAVRNTAGNIAKVDKKPARKLGKKGK